MTQLFISYRTKDLMAKLIHERLRGVYGAENVFFDREDIRSSDNWQDVLNEALAKTDVLIAVLGPNWCDASSQGGLTRLHDENDWVRRELECAFKAEVPIFPVLLDVDTLPAQNLLPESLQRLYDIQYLQVKTKNFERDINHLIGDLERKGFVTNKKVVSEGSMLAEIQDLISTNQLNQLETAAKRLVDYTRNFKPQDQSQAMKSLKSTNKLALEQSNGKLSDTTSIQDLVAQLQSTLNGLKGEDTSIKVDRSMNDLIGDTAYLQALLAEELRSRTVPNDILVSLKEVRKKYKNFELNVPLLELRLGEIIGLVGENATGKTTLLRIIAGDLMHSAGELKYPKWQKGNKYQWAAFKKRIAYVPQQLSIWHGSLIDNLKFEAALHDIKGKENKEELEYIIERFGLTAYIDKSWQQLSGGYKLRFALAKALIKKPELLVLDEPLANLDIKTQIIILNDLKNLTKSLKYPLSVIISTQHLEEVEAIADQMLFMQGGELEHLGNTKEYGKNRSFNLFELTCDIDFITFREKMKSFQNQETYSNGMQYFIKTDLEQSAYDVLDYLKAQDVTIYQFKDISLSIKTKFYETYF